MQPELREQHSSSPQWRLKADEMGLPFFLPHISAEAFECARFQAGFTPMITTQLAVLCRSSGSLYSNTSVSVAASALWRLPLVYLVMNVIRIGAIMGQSSALINLLRH